MIGAARHRSNPTFYYGASNNPFIAPPDAFQPGHETDVTHLHDYEKCTSFGAEMGALFTNFGR
jgi:hypothetical protein